MNTKPYLEAAKIDHQMTIIKSEIRQIEAELKYITYPKIRAVAENMAAGKKTKLDNLKAEKARIIKQIEKLEI